MKRSTRKPLTTKKLRYAISHIAKIGMERSPEYIQADEVIGRFLELVSKCQSASMMVRVGEHLYLVRAIRGLPYPTVAKKKPRK
jgi:hypothetical protein